MTLLFAQEEAGEGGGEGAYRKIIKQEAAEGVRVYQEDGLRPRLQTKFPDS